MSCIHPRCAFVVLQLLTPFTRLVVLMVLLLTLLRFSLSGKSRELTAFANSRGNKRGEC